jgi:hypothetical protein
MAGRKGQSQAAGELLPAENEPQGPPPAAPPPPAAAPPPAAPPSSGTEPALLRMAFLLAAAAMAAAIVGARVSMLSGEASGKWESAVRLEVKRAAGAQESVRYLYDVEVPLAIRIIEARLIETRLEALPSGQTSGQAVAIEKGVQIEVLKALEPSSDLTKPIYALPSGGVDLGKRLADLRQDHPDQLTLDPESTQTQGDLLAQKAERLSLALVPFGLCALLGVLAQAFASRRRQLLRSGWVVFALGAAVAVAVEVLL